MTKTPATEINAKALSLISHKFKTPLSIITGYTEAMLSQSGKERFSPFTLKALEEINLQGEQLSRLLDKLTAFNQVLVAQEAGINKQEVSLKPLIKQCAAKAIEREGDVFTVNPQETNATKKGTFVEIDCPENLSLHGNEEMLNLCVQELISNAIKFNNKLEKIIKVQATNHGDCISVSVRDYGTGIRPHDVERIFETFYQVDDDFTGQVSGWGLGLPMVKRILDLHNGSISVVSDRGLGSIFTINFPIV